MVAYWLHPGVLYCRQRIRRHRQAGDATGHRAVNVAVVEGHQRRLVAVFIMHAVDDVQRADVLHRQPVHKVVEAGHHGVVVQHLIAQRRGFRPHLDLQFLIHPAVNCVEQRFGQIGAGAEELHLLADDHRADAAGDGVVVAVEIAAHQIVVLILQRRGGDRDPGGIFFKRRRQRLRPEHGQVRLRRRAHGVQSMQIAEGGFADQGATIQPHAAQHLRRPDGIPGEQRIKFRGAQETHHADLHDKVVNQLLGLLLIQ